MIKDVLQSIANIEIYPIIALILFVISFLVVTIKALKMDKTEVARLSRLPLDDSESPDSFTESASELINPSGE